MRKKTLLPALFLSFFFWAVRCSGETQEKWIPVAIHIATTVSDGSLTLRDVILAAREKNIRAVIVTDRDVMKWEYGIRPLEHLVKRTKETGSVFKFGILNYLRFIELESSQNPDMVIIPGVETAPSYYWQGIPFSKNFSLCGWHKHLLVFGLKDADDYARLPVVSNQRALRRPLCWRDIPRLWPFLALLLGSIIFRKRECSYRDSLGRELGKRSRGCKVTGLILMALSSLALLNESPFSPTLYDQFCSSGYTPYQTLIDYVRTRGGLVFWAHPEANFVGTRGGVKIRTEGHPDALWQTRDYTGFSIFYEGYKKIGKVGGDWDFLSGEYCRGQRRSPVWVIAGLAFDQGSVEDLKRAMSDTGTYVFASEASPEGILDAMRRGKMYVSRGAAQDKILLDEFRIKDAGTGQTAEIGGEIRLSGKPLIEIRGSLESGGKNSFDIDVVLIKNGEVLKVFKTTAPFDMNFEDDKGAGVKDFYRLEIRTKDQLIVTNPIFVRS